MTDLTTTDELFFTKAGLDRSRVEDLTTHALDGADDGELFLEYCQSESISFDDGRVRSASFDTSQGFGLRSIFGDAAGYVTKSSGEGIYFAAKSGRMAAEAIVEVSKNGSVIPTEKQIKSTYLKRWDRKYGATYTVLDILQRIFYRNDAAREAFVEMCDDRDVQKLTFDSYLYKRVVMMNPWQQIKLTLRTLGSLVRGEALAPSNYSPVPSAVGRSDGDFLAEEAAQAVKAQAKKDEKAGVS